MVSAVNDTVFAVLKTLADYARYIDSTTVTITQSSDVAPINSPVAGLIDSDGFITWMKYFDSSLLGIAAVKLGPN